ncbi:hypothetical protein JY651_45670 [Pyxidicoccus parkwayensis]|uniref:Uncharacterized protein n=1 Tax=Pyxidicoccus parkwayensis TaxID=2813578 RepID=A0ABX7NTV6_9BACT|nr:hypothetical protein [Pyxidicoccus parkwaysis]QSQ22337.1 hypothetical protein JY651_45670 [Pyxidicoccus parkwaysis]
MVMENWSENQANVERMVTGRIVDAGPDHLTVHDLSAGEDITVRIDDRARYSWTDVTEDGRLTDNAQIRIGYYIAGGLHIAAEVRVLDPGDGEPIDYVIPRTLH